MSGTLVHDSHILHEMRPLYYVAKALGIAPFSFKMNKVTNKEVVDIRFISNIGGFTVSAVIFITLLTGFISCAVEPEFSFRSDPGDALCNTISVPINLISSLLLVIMTSTIHRYKAEELVDKLNVIDEGLCQIRGECTYLRDKNKVQLYIPILALTTSFMCYDAFVWSKHLNITFCIIKRFSHLITLVAIMHFCKLVQTIRSRLFGIHEILSLIISGKLSQTSSSYIFSHESRKAINKACTFGSNIMQMTSVDVLSNPMSLKNVTADLKTLPVTDMQTILNLRIIYNHIYECAKIINFLFGITVLIDMSRTFTGLTAGVYSVVIFFNEPIEDVTSLNFSEFVISRTIWIIILLGTIVSLTAICEMAASSAKGVGHKVQTLLLENPLRNDVLEQLKLFSQQISNDKIQFTASGLFTINLSLFCTFMASVTTYIIVLYQFKPY
ncbi:hypothetical protein L798_12327 [Zootermopsis nevadensis]|uniref:Gustatory receptor n=1 Tax=Zootermopsis nevadensis TaxID=136037 RepID=A0A067R3K5_ZOONE|nr:hypothetical protein L798_12327 [Zootermopsis nevadensis]